jgi:hypothetical protein
MPSTSSTEVAPKSWPPSNVASALNPEIDRHAPWLYRITSLDRIPRRPRVPVQARRRPRGSQPT